MIGKDVLYIRIAAFIITIISLITIAVSSILLLKDIICHLKLNVDPQLISDYCYNIYSFEEEQNITVILAVITSIFFFRLYIDRLGIRKRNTFLTFLVAMALVLMFLRSFF